MISGFSEQLLKVFMNNDDFNPEKIVYEILEPYKVNVEVDANDI
jgi:ATP-dependent Clp protease adapter protein ClpS